MSPLQLLLSFDPPNFDNLEDLISHVAYSCGKPLKVIASECDWSPSQLSQYLHDRNFPAKKIPEFIKATAPKGYDIIHWLAIRFLAPPEDRIGQAVRVIQQVAPLLPELQKAMAILAEAEKTEGKK